MPNASIEVETETLRQLVIAARTSPDVEADATACLNRLNALYKRSPDLFTPEDVRFVNVLRGTLAVRLAAHKPTGKPFARISRPRGVKLDHCWRCETPYDERFTEACPDCATKAVKPLVCPVCRACGCQQAGKVLV